jgi:hypothetical protein
MHEAGPAKQTPRIRLRRSSGVAPWGEAAQPLRRGSIYITLARSRSLDDTAPTSTPCSSTTSTQVMRAVSIRSAAAAASRSGPMVRGPACMTCCAVSSRRSPPRSMRRRRSPSVKMPTGRPSASTTAVQPRPLALISRSISSMRAWRGTLGTSPPLRMMSRTWVSSLRPSAPPGWERAKSSSLKPRASSRATASASPSASCAVVLAVGARFIGQASFSTRFDSTRSACRASVDSARPVMATTVTPMRLSAGRMACSSSLSPELEIASTTSPGATMPRSPWLASAGCTNSAGVPVEASVAAILRPTWPLLPMPITTTRPRQASMHCTAAAKAAPCCAFSAIKAWASISSVWCAM